MPELEPITREEMLLDGEDLTPITRKEKFIKRIYDKTQSVPEPITREEMFLKKAGEGSGGDIDLQTLNVTENGTVNAPSGVAFNKVVTNVPLPENAYLLKEVANLPQPIASFSDGSDNPLKSITVSIEPVQAGSGDPSPTNVRPISGWSEANVSVCGKNLIDVSKLAQQVVTSRGDLRPGVPAKLQAGSNTISAQSGTLPLYITRPANNYSYITIDALPFTFSLDNEEEVIVRIAQPDMSSWDYVDLQLEEGSTATTYEPYAGTTITIPFVDGQGQSVEVFGGSVDVINGGEQPNTKAKIDLYTLDWTYQSNNSRFYAASPSDLLRPSDNAQAFNGLCSAYLVSPYAEHGDKAIAVTTTGSMFIFDTDYTDATALKTFLQNNNVQLAYELATPTTFYTQPTSIKSLDGDNNVFASTGDVLEAEYFSKEV